MVNDPHDRSATPAAQQHSAFAASTSLGMLLRQLGASHDESTDDGSVLRLAHPKPSQPTDAAEIEAAPFLSVVVRTMGTRLTVLREVLLCLAAQTDRDFEVELVTHNISADALEVLTASIARLPHGISSRIRVHQAAGGTRARPLNVGLEVSRGNYVVFLDDDDYVFAHWVETFHELARKAPGTVLRARCATQPATVSAVGRVNGAYTTASLSLPYDADFSLSKHLSANQTPFMSAAFPRDLHTVLGESFDESLTTTEDWDYLLRAAGIVGVTDSPEVTAIYRQWQGSQTSRTLHQQAEWMKNQRYIEDKINQRVLLLQPGEASRIRHMHEEIVTVLHEDYQRRVLQHEAISLLRSRRWRLSAPFRGVRRLLGGSAGASVEHIVDSSTDDLRILIAGIRNSRWWKFFRHF